MEKWSQNENGETKPKQKWWSEAETKIKTFYSHETKVEALICPCSVFSIERVEFVLKKTIGNFKVLLIFKSIKSLNKLEFL